jgi:hypothetical protein
MDTDVGTYISQTQVRFRNAREESSADFLFFFIKNGFYNGRNNWTLTCKPPKRIGHLVDNLGLVRRQQR